MTDEHAATSIARLRRVMQRLRDPDTGCPWDIKQTFSTIAPYTIEEAYEVADAIAREDHDELRDELGDLLFQVVFHAQMADESGLFDFDDVTDAIVDKMTRRHPHVFGHESFTSDEELHAHWEATKAKERAGKSPKTQTSVLDGIAINLPALNRAQKIQKRAAQVGFDWTELDDVIAKINEELVEVTDEIDSDDATRIQDEVGDLLFAVVNLSRHLGVDAETALRQANDKFARRFGQVEIMARNDGMDMTAASLPEMDALWNAVKEQETD